MEEIAALCEAKVCAKRGPYEEKGQMITNIIDRRTNPYRWKTVDVIVEATWHDNSCPGDQAPYDYREPDYDERRSISLSDAVSWAMSLDVSLTLYVYDEGTNSN